MNTNFDAVNKVWFGAKNEPNIDRNQNFGEILLKQLDSESDRVMQIDGDTGEALTKAEVRIRTIRCAQNLSKLGCTQNDRIGIIARNHAHLTPLLFGAVCIGSPVTPLDVILSKDEISHFLRGIRPSFIFCDDDVLEMVNEITVDIGLKTKLFTVKGTADNIDSIDSLMVETGQENSFACTKLEDAYSHTALIACSSGSTGLPKSICISNAFFSYSFANPTVPFPLLMLNFSSFYWFSGIWAAFMSANASTRVFTARPFSADLFFDLVEKHKVQFFLGPPCQLQSVLRYDRCKTADLSSLIVSIAVGSHVPTILTQTMKKLIPKCNFITCYGMTEIGGSASITKPNELDEYPNTVGCPLPGVSMTIISPETNERCGIGEEGEICIKIPIRVLGYYENEEANRAAFDAQGYFITGDIGHFDESGRLFVAGRKTEIFKNCGRFVSPIELENIIIKHPHVQEVCVVSVFDDEIVTDLPAAVVVRTKNSLITENDVYSMIADRFASHKHLDGGVYFIDEFPLTPSGKVGRAKVKAIAQQLFESKQLNRNIER